MMPRVIAVVCLAILAGCAAPGIRQARVAEPTPCADSTYLQLIRQHPDSLTERGWQRLQSLDRACAATRTGSSHRETTATTNGNYRGHRMWLGAAAMMVAMMLAVR